MMGVQPGAPAGREQLEAPVPADRLLRRRVDRALDLAGVRAQLAARYSRIGRPSVDPEVLLRLLLVGYPYGITSERRLVEEVRVNAAYRWFAGLPFGVRVPHHSTFSTATAASAPASSGRCSRRLLGGVSRRAWSAATRARWTAAWSTPTRAASAGRSRPASR